MRMLFLILIAVATLPTAASARPGDIWQFESDADYAVLHYGIPPSQGEQDMPGLLCQAHHGISAVLFTDNRHFPTRAVGEDDRVDARGRREPWAVTLTLSSGALTATLPAQATWEPDDELVQVEAHIPPASPVLSAFSRTGRIQIRALGDGAPLPPAPMGLVRRFLAACRALG